MELLALAAIAIGAVLWERHQSRKAVEDTTHLFEGIVARMTNERVATEDAHRKEVSELLTRIQAPEAAPFVVGTNPGKQYVTEDDDEEGWKALKEQFENGNG